MLCPFCDTKREKRDATCSGRLAQQPLREPVPAQALRPRRGLCGLGQAPCPLWPQLACSAAEWVVLCAVWALSTSASPPPVRIAWHQARRTLTIPLQPHGTPTPPLRPTSRSQSGATNKGPARAEGAPVGCVLVPGWRALGPDKKPRRPGNQLEDAGAAGDRAGWHWSHQPRPAPFWASQVRKDSCDK